MRRKPITLIVFLWIETIIGARVLMFTLPVMLNKFFQGNLVLVRIEDWTIFTLSLIAFFYFLTGMAAILNIRGWRLFHYLGVAVTITLTCGLIKKTADLYNHASLAFFIPVVMAVLMAVLVTVIKEENQAVRSIKN